MFNSLLRLLARSWSHLMTAFSMSTVGFVALSCGLPVVIYFARVLVPAYFKRTSEGFWKNVVARTKSSGLETIISVGVVVLFWIISLSVSFVQTIYNEHQTFVSANSQLTQQTATLSKERDDWKAKFAAADDELRTRPKQPVEQGSTKDRVSAVVNEKRCWLTNHFGFPNSTISGAVTATAAIIHCNYKIDAPFLIQVEFDREFIPGGTTLNDVGGFMSDGEGKTGLVRWNRISTPALLSEQIVVVTVYGKTDQYPRAKAVRIETLQ
jgi:hypothetical protein